MTNSASQVQRLVFTEDNWRQPRRVSVTAPAADGDHRDRMATLTFSVDSSAADYQDASLTVPVAIENRESPIVFIYFTRQPFEIDEGESIEGEARFTIAPPRPTTMRFESDDPQTLFIRPGTLRFTADNWDTLQPSPCTR